MAHTYCDVRPSPLACTEYFVALKEDYHELRDEDSNFRQALESCMRICALLQMEHIGPFSKFCASGGSLSTTFFLKSLGIRVVPVAMSTF